MKLPYDGAGNFSRTPGTRIANQGALVSAQVNDETDNLVVGVNGKVNRDGTLAMTGIFNAGGFKITGVASGNTTNDAVTFGQIGGWINLSRITDSVITSNTTLANDSTMTFTMAANGNYEIEADIYFALSGGGYKISAAGPTATLVNLLMNAYEVGGTTVRTSATTYNGLVGTAAAGQCRITMQVRNGAGAGAFALQFAQNTSSPTSLYILFGSKMRYRVTA